MGSKRRARQHIIEAAEAGADACKFQLFRLEDILHDTGKGDRRWELSVTWLYDLAYACERAGIDFLCTPFSKWAVRCLEKHVWAYKIGSFEWRHKDLWKEAIATGKPIIASSGRGLPVEYNRARILYCVSKYPADPADIYLKRLATSQYAGFSDHTTSTLIPAFAVACGARIIEKHFRTADTPVESPDYPHSIEIGQFAEMVANIRLAEQTCWREPPEFQDREGYANRKE